MKKLQQVGVTTILVASLAASAGSVASASGHPRAVRPNAPVTHSQREAAYQHRLSFLASVLETDHIELEQALTRLAKGLSIY